MIGPSSIICCKAHCTLGVKYQPKKFITIVLYLNQGRKKIQEALIDTIKRERESRRLTDETNLLVASLYTAITTVQSCYISIFVTQQLNLEMPALIFQHERCERKVSFYTKL